jgi:acyl-CoA synthetase (AMP-forming)/AMP-acid ligase II
MPGVGSWIERRAVRAPDAVALITPDGVRTYGTLAREIRATAALLRARGLRPGDRVAFHGVNDPTALLSLFGGAAAGAVWVPVHPARPEDEVRTILQDSGARLLVRASPATHPATGIGELEAAELLGATADGDAEPPGGQVDGGGLAILAYTSGTTGPPKGVMLTHANLLWNVIQMVAECTIAASDVTLAAAPFTRIGGIGVTVLPTLFAGGAVVVPGTVDGRGVLDTIERARVTVAFANPDLLQEMLRAPGWDAADLSSVRTGVVGGGLAPEGLLRAFLDRGVPLLHGYGLTEASPVVSLLDPPSAMRAGSVGRPLPFVEVQARRPDGSRCEAGEAGEWWIRGPNVSSGYWRHPSVRDADGWFPTGDAGVIEPDGYLTFLDRASSAMRLGAATVYPATIEARLFGVPGLADAAAVDVDGRIVLAIVVDDGADVDPAALLADLRDGLRPNEVPAEVRRVARIPRNAAAKVRRAELRELLVDAP